MTAVLAEPVGPDYEALYDDLAKADPGLYTRATALIQQYMREQMLHRHTGQPRRSLLRQLMPPLVLRPLADWQARGVDRALIEPTDHYDNDRQLYAERFGSLFYEIAEQRLAREDYERRLAARQVGKAEWRRSEGWRRRRLDGPADALERVAYQVMGELAAVIR